MMNCCKDMTTPNAIVMGAVVSAFIIALAMYITTPAYEFVTVNTSSNPAIWKVDRFNGDVFLCVTGAGKDAESGCSKKMKQF